MRVPSIPWVWVALDQLIALLDHQNGISPKTTTRINAPKAITLTATTSGYFNPAYFKHVEAVIPATKFILNEGDLLFRRGNAREMSEWRRCTMERRTHFSTPI